MAARKKTLLRGVRIPRVGPTKTPTKTPTKKTATKKTATKKRPVVKRTAPASLRERVEQTLESIGARMSRVEIEYYEIGQALLSLDRPEIWRDAFELRSFSAFIEKHLMSYSTARRLLVVAREYTKAIAAQIGLDRGYHLDRLVRSDPEIKRSAQQLWIANVALGPAGQKKRVRDLTGPELANLVQQALMKAGRSRIEKPTNAMKKSADRYKKSLPYKAKVRFDMKTKDVVVRISIEDFLKHY